MQTQSKVGFLINYNQGKEQSPWRSGKENIKIIFFILGLSVSNLFLLHLVKIRGRQHMPLLTLSHIVPHIGCGTFKEKRRGRERARTQTRQNSYLKLLYENCCREKGLLECLLFPVQLAV